MEILILNINEITPDAYCKAFSHLAPEKRLRVQHLKNPSDKLRVVGGDMAARCLLSKNLGINSSLIEIKKDKRGKPYVDYERLFLSISHSGNYALCALSVFEVGADIERTGRVSEMSARRFFTATELEYASQDTELRFTRLWTLKEAQAKASGNGILSLDGRREIKIVNGEIQYHFENRKLYSYAIPDGYVISVCELMDT